MELERDILPIQQPPVAFKRVLAQETVRVLFCLTRNLSQLLENPLHTQQHYSYSNMRMSKSRGIDEQQQQQGLGSGSSRSVSRMAGVQVQPGVSPNKNKRAKKISSFWSLPIRILLLFVVLYLLLVAQVQWKYDLLSSSHATPSHHQQGGGAGAGAVMEQYLSSFETTTKNIPSREDGKPSSLVPDQPDHPQPITPIIQNNLKHNHNDIRESTSPRLPNSQQQQQQTTLTNPPKSLLHAGDHDPPDPPLSSIQNREEKKHRGYEVSLICPACRHVQINRHDTCGDKVDQVLSSKSMDIAAVGDDDSNQTNLSTAEDRMLMRALIQVSQRYPDSCAPCHPTACSHHPSREMNHTTTATTHDSSSGTLRGQFSYTKYWYFDRAAPTVKEGVTHYLSSIPSSARVPNDVSTLLHETNVTQILLDKWNNGKRTDLFWEYNPTIAVLPLSWRTKLQKQMEQVWPTTGNSTNDPVYVASFRVSSNHGCYPWETVTQHLPGAQVNLMKDQNYLGLALLRHDLTMIPQTDLVVDAETQLGVSRKPGLGQHFVDYRLFGFNDKIYMNINGSPVYWVSLQLDILANPPTTQEPPPPFMSKQELFHHDGSKDGPIRFRNKFGSDHLQVSFEEAPKTIFGLYKGKNFAIFQPPHLQSSGALVAEVNVYRTRQTVEFQPHGMHVLSHCQVNQHVLPPNRAPSNCTFDENNQSVQEQQERLTKVLVDRSVPVYSIYRREVAVAKNGTLASTDEPPPPTFATIDELWFAQPVFKSVPHGGACCAHVDLSSTETSRSNNPPNAAFQGDRVLVGIGHTKIPYRKIGNSPEMKQRAKDMPHHQYVSFFYAFDPTPPYRIVARSGLFCLPFASQSEQEEVNAYHALTRVRPLTLKQHAFECPQISFVSSIIDHGTDPENKVILSYGINDCTPRMVVMEKQEIVRFLFLKD